MVVISGGAWALLRHLQPAADDAHPTKTNAAATTAAADAGAAIDGASDDSDGFEEVVGHGSSSGGGGFEGRVDTGQRARSPSPPAPAPTETNEASGAASDYESNDGRSCSSGAHASGRRSARQRGGSGTPPRSPRASSSGSDCSADGAGSSPDPPEVHFQPEATPGGYHMARAAATPMTAGFAAAAPGGASPVPWYAEAHMLGGIALLVMALAVVLFQAPMVPSGHLLAPIMWLACGLLLGSLHARAPLAAAAPAGLAVSPVRFARGASFTPARPERTAAGLATAPRAFRGMAGTGGAAGSHARRRSLRRRQRAPRAANSAVPRMRRAEAHASERARAPQSTGRSLSREMQAAATPGSSEASSRAPAESVADQARAAFAKADAAHAGGDSEGAWQAVKPYTRKAGSRFKALSSELQCEALWRAARHFNRFAELAAAAADKTKAFATAWSFVERALAANERSADAHKWAAIVLGSMGDSASAPPGAQLPLWRATPPCLPNATYRHKREDCQRLPNS